MKLQAYAQAFCQRSLTINATITSNATTNIKSFLDPTTSRVFNGMLKFTKGLVTMGMVLVSFSFVSVALIRCKLVLSCSEATHPASGFKKSRSNPVTIQWGKKKQGFLKDICTVSSNITTTIPPCICSNNLHSLLNLLRYIHSA